MERADVTDGLVSLRSPGLPGVLSTRAAIVTGGAEAGSVTFGPSGHQVQAAVVSMRRTLSDIPVTSATLFRGLQLALHHLATRTSYRTAVLAVPVADGDLLAVAAAAGFRPASTVTRTCYLTRPVPPLTYTDGVITIRRQEIEDIDAHLAGIDDDQIDWLWGPLARRGWEALTPAEQRAHNLAHLRRMRDSFGAGPKWTFSADTADAPYVTYVDCDLANDAVPAGQANVSYTTQPLFRGRGYTSRSVRLVASFLREHTGATQAHIIVDERNVASLRVARAVGAVESGRFRTRHGDAMIRHILPLRPPAGAAG